MRNISLIQNLPYTLPPIQDITDELPRHKTKVYQMRRPQDIDTIIIHHMASEAPLINQAKHHVNNENWPGIGYHLVISDERLYQVNDLCAESYHAKGWNHRSIGISVRGNLSRRQLMDAERILLHAAILTVKSYFPSITQVIGHNEASKMAQVPGTSCPCIDLNRLRTEVADIEEKKQYVETNGNKERINRMFLRMANLQKRYVENGQFTPEAERKLLLVDDALVSNGFYE